MLTIFLRQYPTVRFISWIFESTSSVIHDLLWKAINCVYRVAHTHFETFPSYEERQKTALQFYGHNIVLILDGTEQKIVEHVRNEIAKKTRSGKKSYHSVSKIVGVTPTGLGRLFGRSHILHHDLPLTVMKENLTGKLDTLKPTESIGGDPAFEGLEEYVNCSVLATPKKQPGGQLGEKAKLLKTNWKTHRTVVENYFSQIKDFKILRETFRVKGKLSEILEKHHRVFLVCAYFIDVYLFPNGTKMVPK